MRILVLCTHNSARSQIGEGWLRYFANEMGFEADVYSAGTERTFVKPDAIATMAEVGIDLSTHSSKIIEDLPDQWNFDVVLTVCDSANEVCPTYPAETNRLHVAFPDPSGESLERWGEVRDMLKLSCKKMIEMLKAGEQPTEAALKETLV